MANFDWTTLTQAAMSHGWIALGALTWLAAIALYVILQVWFGCAWSGRWRVVALVPLIVLAALALMFSILQGSNPEVFGPRGPILDNLVVALLLASPIGFVYLVIAGIVHRSHRRPVLP
jgi:hypothetical protein